MRAKPVHDPNPFSSGASLSKDQDRLKEHLRPAPSPLPGLTEYETEGPQRESCGRLAGQVLTMFLKHGDLHYSENLDLFLQYTH